MKVEDLMQILRDLEPDATVVLMADTRTPTEYRVTGVAQRWEYWDGEDHGGLRTTDSGADDDVLILFRT
jgi:hypothetical protein